ncbi:MAG: Hsp33 family molecular chaperone HslO, partial [Clostridia bacterium]|nr:Hsp33 family molecular chaperone HslO [Clostridia bacterium]
SEERLEQVVISIGSKDLKQIIEDDGKAELICQFCETKYLFDKEHLEVLLKESMKKEEH